MEKAKIQRINELAAKSKTTGLTDAEKEEQKNLRAQYRSEFRASFEGILKNTYIVNEKGEKGKVVKG